MTTHHKKISPELCSKFKALAAQEGILSQFLFHLTNGYRTELAGIYNSRQEAFLEVTKSLGLSPETNIHINFETGEVTVNNPGTGVLQ